MQKKAVEFGESAKHEKSAKHEMSAISGKPAKSGKPVKHGNILDMVLCPKCERHYKSSGYLLVHKGFQEYKDACDFCQVGRGVTFGVFPRRNTKK